MKQKPGARGWSIALGVDSDAQPAAEKRASTLAEVAEQSLIEHVEAKRAASTASGLLRSTGARTLRISSFL
jgi:hypothetical protein